MKFKKIKGTKSIQSKGLGDTIEKITKATGIHKVVTNVSQLINRDCGCNKRKEKLNKKFPYKTPNDEIDIDDMIKHQLETDLAILKGSKIMYGKDKKEI